MPVMDYISSQLQKYKTEHGLSLEAMSVKFDISKSCLYEYINGRGNLRADTIELIAEHMGISLSEMFSDPSPSYEKAQHVVLAAKELGSLSQERREAGINLFLLLVSLFSE